VAPWFATNISSEVSNPATVDLFQAAPPRPAEATQMPHFDKYAYEDKSCYGMSAEEVGKNKPPDPHSTTLTKREIEAVADYVLAKFTGK
jgi:hypothetical protein